eukprot:COSAG01_NODE_2874_length_6937_cov_4.473823_2_plen_66_part_00
MRNGSCGERRYKPSHEALESLGLRDGCNKIEFCVAGLGAAAVGSFSAAVLTEVYLCGICSLVKKY